MNCVQHAVAQQTDRATSTYFTFSIFTNNISYSRILSLYAINIAESN